MCGILGLGLAPECAAQVFAQAAIQIVSLVLAAVLFAIAAWLVSRGSLAGGAAAGAAGLVLLAGPIALVPLALIAVVWYLFSNGQPVAGVVSMLVGLAVVAMFVFGL